MVTDDQYIAVLERTRETGRPRHGARRERLGDRPAGAPRARRGQHRPDLPRAHAARRARGRGDVARRPARRVRRRAGLHRPRDLPRGGRCDHRGPRARRAGLRRDVPAVPAPDRGRPARARTSRARATSARRRCARPTTRRRCGTRSPSTTCRSSRPTTARSRTSRSGSGCGDFSKIPNGLAVIQHRLTMLWEHGVRTGRLTPSRLVEITSSSVAKLFGLYPQKGTIAPGADADIVIFDPEREFVFGTRDARSCGSTTTSSRASARQGSPRTTLSRGTVVYDDGRILTRPGHGRFVRRSTPRPLPDRKALDALRHHRTPRPAVHPLRRADAARRARTASSTAGRTTRTCSGRSPTRS